MSTGSERRRAENEVIFRAHNERLEKTASQVLSPNEEMSYPLAFVCECSNEDCKERIEIPVNEFVKMRENRRQFIIVAGHEQPDIEHVISKRNEYVVVEKYEEPPMLMDH